MDGAMKLKRKNSILLFSERQRRSRRRSSSINISKRKLSRPRRHLIKR
jgi:hypothetical protein